MVCIFYCKRLLLSLCALTSTISAQDTSKTVPKPHPKSINLSYELLNSPSIKAQPLATIDYDPKSLEYTLASWTPPLSELDTLKSPTSSEPVSAPLLRVLTPDGSSTVTSLAGFDTSLSQDINIWISVLDGSVTSASINSRPPPPLSAEEKLLREKEDRLRKRGKPVPPRQVEKKSKSQKAKELVVEEAQAGPVVRVNLLLAGKGVTPKLHTRAAPVVDAEGKEVEQEVPQEKSLIQKYWYVGLILAFMLISTGGGGDK